MVRILTSATELRRTADAMRKSGIEYALLARSLTALGTTFPAMPDPVTGFVTEILERVGTTLTSLARELVGDSSEVLSRAAWLESDDAAALDPLGPLELPRDTTPTSDPVAPRPEPGWREPVSMPAPVFEAVIGPGRPYSRSEMSMLLGEEPGAPHRKADVLSMLSYGVHDLRHLDDDSEVLDAGEKGYWFVDRRGETIHLTPTTQVEVEARLNA